MKKIVFLTLSINITLFHLTMAAGPSAVPTFHSLGLYWSPSQGALTNECQVKYRVLDAGQWKNGYSLWFDTRNSEYRGSIIDLDPNTTYEIKLTLLSTSITEIFTATTWSEDFPIAQTIYLPENSNQTYTIPTSGTASGYILYTYNLGSSATIDVQKNHNYCIEIPGASHHIIIRDLALRGASMHGIKIWHNCTDIIIEECDISEWGSIDSDGFGVGYQSAIESPTSNTIKRIIVQRNTIHHPSYDTNCWDEGGHPGGPQAVCFWNSGGNHVIRYNNIYGDPEHYYNDILGAGSNASETHGFPTADTDIYGNILKHSWDNPIESEGANRNVRIWGNYIDSSYAFIAIAGTAQGPIYIFRNYSAVGRKNPFDPWGIVYQGGFIKTGLTNNGGKIYIFHNTLLQPTLDGVTDPVGVEVGIGHGGPNFNVMSRNNILHVYKNTKLSIRDRNYDPDSDYDYDLYNGEIQAFSPYETHGIHDVPIYDPVNQEGEYALDPFSPGYDDGLIIKNFNDGYTGAGPDMGAFEAGSSPMEFGPNAYLGPPPTQYDLTINTSGSGSVSPPGGSFNEGSVLTLTANPDVGYQFDNWSGDLSGTANPESITMDIDKTVTAFFSSAPPRTLTVNTSGPGSVALDPPGGSYATGSIVTLTANPDAGYMFDVWSGELTSTVNPETITMDTDKTVTASFVVMPEVLIYDGCDATIVTGKCDNIHAGYTGNGFADTGNYTDSYVEWSVSVSEVKSYNCTIRYANGSTAARPADIKINGIVQTSVLFALTGAWSTWINVSFSVNLEYGVNIFRVIATNADGCPNIDKLKVKTGTGSSPAQYTLTMNTSGNGSVSLDPAGGTYNEDTVVMLTANPDAGNQFDNWAGDLTGTANPGMLTMDADKTVTANFSESTGGSYNYNTVEDAFVRGGSYSTNNYGSDPQLHSKGYTGSGNNDRHTYLKFDLCEVSGTITSATLKLYVEDAALGGPPNSVFLAVDDSWDEGTITWDNAPGFQSGASDTRIMNLSDEQTVVDFDVTSLVNSEVTGDKIVSIVITDTTLYSELVKYCSKEGAKDPVLTIVTSDGVSSVDVYDGCSANIVTGSCDNDNAGYTGAGFANTSNAIDMYVEWTSVEGYTTGSHNCAIRYANGSVNAHTVDIKINDIVDTSLTFASTGDWTAWSTENFSVDLDLGKSNNFKIVATTSEGCANIDKLEIIRTRTVVDDALSEASEKVIPKEMKLLQNFPNPFNPSTSIHYILPKLGHVSLRVYDMKGRLVSVLVDKEQDAGEHTEIWEAMDSSGRQLPTGMYLCWLKIGSRIETIKMMFMR
jgi:hypothetical protein